MKYIGQIKMTAEQAIQLEHHGFKVDYIQMADINNDYYDVFSNHHEENPILKEIERRLRHDF